MATSSDFETGASIGDLSVIFALSVADVPEKTPKYYETYSILLPVRTAAKQNFRIRFGDLMGNIFLFNCMKKPQFLNTTVMPRTVLLAGDSPPRTFSPNAAFHTQNKQITYFKRFI